MFMTALSRTEIDAYNAKGGAQAQSTDPQAAQDRFLKLFVAQLSNQDPLNPMDNAQMTSQMAQINTVTGIQQLNQTVKALAEQFGQTQAAQAASLVGRQVVAEGNALSVHNGVVQGSFSLPQASDSVRVDVLSQTGELLGSTSLGPRGAGLQHFDWVPEGVDAARAASMQVHAMANGQALTAMPLARQRIESVGIIEGQVHLRGADGSTLKQQDVLAFL
jgi:flagellar basal-body rod modification protein FlgD